MSFAVIEFPPQRNEKSCSVEVVPASWLDRNRLVCRWPRTRIQQLVRNASSQPSESWSEFSVNRIFGTYDTYQRALTAAEHFLDCSESEREEPPVKRKRGRNLDSQDEVTVKNVVPEPDGVLYGIPSLSLVSSPPASIQSQQDRHQSEPGTSGEVEPFNVILCPDSDSLNSSVLDGAAISLTTAEEHALQSFGIDCSGSNLFLQDLSVTNAANEPGTARSADSIGSSYSHNQQLGNLEHQVTPRRTLEQSRKHTRSFQEIVIRELASVKETQKETIRLLNSILAKSAPELHQGSECDLLPGLPLSSLDQLTTFNERLRNQSDFEKTVRYFSLIGGSGYKDIIRNILRRLVSRDLSLQLTFFGNEKKAKLSFSKYDRLPVLVLDACRRHQNLHSIPESDVNQVMKDYFRFLKPISSNQQDQGAQQDEEP